MEAEARAALRAFEAVADIEQWIAEQPWEAAAGRWLAGCEDSFKAGAFCWSRCPVASASS